MKRMNSLGRETLPRIVLGLAYLPGALNFFSVLIFGAGFLPLLASQSGPLPIAGQFLAAMGQLFPFMLMVKVVTLSSAIMLLINRAPAFAVALLTPVTAGIVLVHLILIPPMVGWTSWVVVEAVWTLVAVVCQLILFGTYARNYRSLFQRPAFES